MASGKTKWRVEPSCTTCPRGERLPLLTISASSTSTLRQPSSRAATRSRTPCAPRRTRSCSRRRPTTVAWPSSISPALEFPADRPLRVLTHCNTGPLAAGRVGTALGIVQGGASCRAPCVWSPPVALEARRHMIAVRYRRVSADRDCPIATSRQIAGARLRSATPHPRRGVRR